MSTWSTRYVRLRDREGDLARLRQTLGAAASGIQSDPSSTFAAIFVATPSLEPDDLSDLSKTFGEAFSIQVHSMADLVIYDHFADGARRRGLTYAGEAGWVRVVGSPEAWESPFFFANDKLEALLQELEDDITDEAALARDEAELKRLFAGGKLEEGNVRPAVQWRSFAQAVARAHGLPDPSPVAASSARIPSAKK